MCERLRFFKHLVARIWTSDPYQQVILTRQNGRDLTLSLTTILASDQYVNITCSQPRPTAKCSLRSSNYVFRSTAVRVNNHIRHWGETIYPPFSLISPDVFICNNLQTPGLFRPLCKTLLKHIHRSCDVYVRHCGSERFPNAIDLCRDPNAVNYYAMLLAVNTVNKSS